MMSDRQVKEGLFLLFRKEQFNSITCINALHMKNNFHQAFSVFINFFAFSFPTRSTYFFCLYWNVYNAAIEKTERKLSTNKLKLTIKVVMPGS